MSRTEAEKPWTYARRFSAIWSASPTSRSRSSGDVFTNSWPEVLSKKGSGLSPAFSRRAFSASTAALLPASTQSRRRSTVNGKMTLPYSDCL